MRKSFLKAFGYFACFAWSSLASAVGFGGINVTSSLGQPLVAEIELVAVEKADKSSLNAHLASPDAFKGAGIDFPYSLPKLKFQIETRPNGAPYVKLTSDQVVNEPFVSLLLELTWSSGRLMREYTFLLDPPGFAAEQPPVAAVKPIEPVVVKPIEAVIATAVAPAVAPSETVGEVAPVVIAAPTPAETAAASAPETAAASAPEAATTVAAAEPVAIEAASAVAGEVQKSEEPKVEPLAKEAPPPAAEVTAVKPKEEIRIAASPITVKRGDTLSKIANQTKSADVSLERMLVALYRANAEEFDAHNMNRIKTGKILRLPDAEEVAKINQAEAVKEVHAQVVDWNAYRQKLAAAKTPVQEQQAKQEVAGKISTSIAEKAPAAKESAKEVLKVSKGEAPGDQTTAGGKAKSGQEKANAKVEDSIAKDKALKDSQDRTALLEKNVKEMQRLVELRVQSEAQAAKDKKSASTPASTLPLVAAPASAVTPASGVAEAKPKPKMNVPKVVAPPPSLLDDLLGDPIYLGGGAAILLGLGGLGFALMRKKKGGNKKLKGDAGEASGRIAAPVQSSPETGDFTHTITATPATTSDADEVDPIGEADLFLNFGRDVQAEEVLKEALQKDPSNNPVKLKLLSIYATRKDTKSFYVYALEIKESGDQAAWKQASAMGREIEPGNTLYGATEANSVAAVSTSDNTVAHSVDLDLGLGNNAQPEVTQKLEKNILAEKSAPAIGEATAIMSTDEMRSAQDTPMDFDITGTHPGTKAFTPESPALNVHAMDFDVSGTHAGVNSGAAEKAHLDVPAMDFDVTGGAAIPSAPPIQAPALNLDDLVFDVAPKAAPATKPAVASPAAEAEKGMDFSLDFPTDNKTTAPATPPKDVGLGEISLNLDGPSAAATTQPSGNKDENWQEVATKLDLAKAYQEMGDQAGAREILEEVLRDGDDAQRASAQGLLQQLV